MKEKILVFIPMYNCEKQIVRVLEQLTGEIGNYIKEAVVVNNRSTDHGEEAVVRKLQELDIKFPVKLLRNHENYGLGGSHKVAFDYALNQKFDYIIVLHGDDQGSICDLLPILKHRSYKKYDCCLGGRFVRGSRLVGYSRFRILGNLVFNIIFSLSLGRRIYDLGAGLNLYAVEMLKTRYYKKFPDNLTFNCYMLFAAAAYNQKYRYFKITWREEDQVSNVKMAEQAWQTFKMALGYFAGKEKYMLKDARKKKIRDYKADLVFESRAGRTHSGRLHLVMPMAGGGTRFAGRGYDVPKPLIQIYGKPFFYWAVQSVAKNIEVQTISFVVLKEHVERYGIDREIKKWYPDAGIYIIPEVLPGPVLTCMEGIKMIPEDEPVLFNDCDHLFICRPLEYFCRKKEYVDADGGILTFRSDRPGYSYAVCREDGCVSRMAEKQVISNDAVCGAYYFKNKQIFQSNAEEYLKKCSYQEFFMSGLMDLMVQKGMKIKSFRVEEHVSFGTPEEYEEALCKTQYKELERET